MSHEQLLLEIEILIRNYSPVWIVEAASVVGGPGGSFQPSSEASAGPCSLQVSSMPSSVELCFQAKVSFSSNRTRLLLGLRAPGNKMQITPSSQHAGVDGFLHQPQGRQGARGGGGGGFRFCQASGALAMRMWWGERQFHQDLVPLQTAPISRNPSRPPCEEIKAWTLSSSHRAKVALDPEI